MENKDPRGGYAFTVYDEQEEARRLAQQNKLPKVEVEVRSENPFISRVIGWVAYTILNFILLLLFHRITWLEHVGLALILGHFSAQFNAIVIHLKRIKNEGNNSNR